MYTKKSIYLGHIFKIKAKTKYLDYGHLPFEKNKK